MSSSDNLIDLKNFESKRKEKNRQIEMAETQKANVVSIKNVREEIINEERRKVKRTLLTEFVGASAILPGSGLVKVTLSDISEGGLAFDVEKKFGSFQSGEEVVLRVYLNHKTYFPLTVKITHSRFMIRENTYRHGSSFVEGALNEEAIHYFIKFMETVSTSLKADLGDLMLTK